MSLSTRHVNITHPWRIFEGGLVLLIRERPIEAALSLFCKWLCYRDNKNPVR
jgi:hypothetical protein